MTSLRAGEHTQNGNYDAGKWKIPVKNFTEAKKIFSKLNKKVYGCVFSENGKYIYRTDFPNFSATFEKADEGETLEDFVLIKFNVSYFDDLQEFLEKNYSYLNL